MRFRDYLNKEPIKDLYITLSSKKDYKKPMNEELERVLRDLNKFIDCYSKEYKFCLSEEFKSPSEVLVKMDEKKIEKITRLWMKKSEELEDIKKIVDKDI